MKIVIDIPEQFEPHFNFDRFYESLLRIENDIRIRGVLSGIYERETITMLREVIKNAAIIPEKAYSDLCLRASREDLQK